MNPKKLLLPLGRIRLVVVLVVSALAVLGAATLAHSITKSEQPSLADQFAEYRQAMLADMAPGSTLLPDQEREALFNAYRSLVPDDDPAALRDLNAQYESLFSQIGFVASPEPASETPSEKPQTEDTGINNDGEDLPGFAVNNRWTGKTEKGYVTVFAGASVDDPKTGAVQVFVDGEPDGGPISAQGIGPLTIVTVDVDKIVLQDDGGSTVTFDVASRSFA